jgi:DNA segregation ATPase FtsK/SpoIIIE-like protein
VTNRSKEQAAAAEPSVWEQRLREAAVLLLIPMIVYLGVCLYTYFPGDPGWSHAGSDTPVRNLGGSVGAWIADLSLYFFGGMAFAFPLMLAAIAWRLIRDESALPGTKHDSAWLLLGAAGWIASGAGLAHLHFFETASPLPANAGGVVGALFGDLLRSAAGELGATLFLFAIFLVMLTLFTGISWFRLMEAIGGAVLNAIAKLRAFWEGREERRAVREVREEREEVRKVDTEKARQARAGEDRAAAAPVVEKSERAKREQQIPLFHVADGPAFRRCRCWTTPSRSPRATTRTRWKRSRARSSSSCGFPDRGAGGRRVSRAGDHPLRDRAGARRARSARSAIARQGHRPRPQREVGARGRRDSRASR